MNSMPEVRRFFYDSVLKREYGDQLDVKFVPGAPPELVLYDADDVEISRTAIGRMKFDELHELVQAHGFSKVVEPEEKEEEEEEADASADVGQQEL